MEYSAFFRAGLPGTSRMTRSSTLDVLPAALELELDVPRRAARPSVFTAFNLPPIPPHASRSSARTSRLAFQSASTPAPSSSMKTPQLRLDTRFAAVAPGDSFLIISAASDDDTPAASAASAKAALPSPAAFLRRTPRQLNMNAPGPAAPPPTPMSAFLREPAAPPPTPMSAFLREPAAPPPTPMSAFMLSPLAPPPTPASALFLSPLAPPPTPASALFSAGPLTPASLSALRRIPGASMFNGPLSAAYSPLPRAPLFSPLATPDSAVDPGMRLRVAALPPRARALRPVRDAVSQFSPMSPLPAPLGARYSEVLYSWDTPLLHPYSVEDAEVVEDGRHPYAIAA